MMDKTTGVAKREMKTTTGSLGPGAHHSPFGGSTLSSRGGALEKTEPEDLQKQSERKKLHDESDPRAKQDENNEQEDGNVYVCMRGTIKNNLTIK